MFHPDPDCPSKSGTVSQHAARARAFGRPGPHPLPCPAQQRFPGSVSDTRARFARRTPGDVSAAGRVRRTLAEIAQISRERFAPVRQRPAQQRFGPGTV